METFAPKGNIQGPILPSFILAKKITFGAKIMYALLCNYAGTKDYCWPSQAKLAERLSCSVSSVKSYLKELKAEGLIEVNHERYKSSTYYMLRPTSSASLQTQLPATSIPDFDSNPQESTSGCQEPSFGYNLNATVFKKTPPLPPKNSSSQGQPPTCKKQYGGGDFAFEEFFRVYPKKEGKELARKAWRSLTLSGDLPSLEIIQLAVASGLATPSWQKESGRFIPMAVNYLRGHRWKDAPIILPLAQPPKPSSEIVSQYKLQENELRQAERQKIDALRPIFDSLASKFANGVSNMAFGLWSVLYEKGIAPTENDIPLSTNGVNFLQWLNMYKLDNIYAY